MHNKYICKYCGKEFDSGQKLGGHMISCKYNPNIKNILDKAKNTRKNKNIEKFNIRETQLTCPVCGKKFILNLSEKKYKSGKYRKTCCSICAHKLTNNHTNLSVKNSKISNTLKKQRFCIQCGNPINVNIRNTSKFCCDECKNVHLRESLSKSLKGKTGGYRVLSGDKKHKSGKYNGIYFDSSWELAFYVYYMDHNMYIDRCSEIRYYTYDNKIRKYHPDFITNDGIIEIKGYMTNNSIEKIKQNPDIKVLYKNDIEKYLKYMEDAYGKNFWEKFYE